MQIAVQYPTLAYDGEMTFAGGLRKYFIELDDAGDNIGISKHWNDETKGKYIRQYETRLIPMLTELYGKDIPLHSYSEDQFEETLRQLNLRYHYAESTLQHYRWLIWVVYKAGFEHGHYVDNIFWADIIDLEEGNPTEREELKAKIMLRTRRSFSIEEEARIANWFLSLDPETVSGEDIGLLLMYFQGVRNNEACGANVGSVHLLQGTQNVPVFEMVQSTEIGSNRLKGGGKTSNAPRVLPVISVFYEFLQKRKDFLTRLVEGGELVLPEEIKSIDNLPLVCRGNRYTVRASTTDLSKAGRALFEKIGIEKKTIALLHQILCSNEFKDLQIGEKEPTTYLFRRNYATLLYHLGFTLVEIQYLIGHDIENPYVDRNSFSDVEKQRSLWERLMYHPVIELITKKDENAAITPERNNMSSHELKIEGNKKEAMLLDIQANALEPCQPISVEIEGEGAKFSATVRLSVPSIEYSRTAFVAKQKRIAYRLHSAMNEET